MNILITGANGMVARSVVNHCLEKGDKVLAFTRQELDITQRESVFDKFQEVKPDAVVNCAAFTDVDGAEEKREQCYSVNASGVENLALASKEIDCRFLTISTDYVFDGEKAGFYDQRDTPNPIGYYGATKYDGEILARKANARSIVVRSGWIFGKEGTNFLSVMDSMLEKGNPIKAIHDAFGTPTFADDLAMRIRQLSELDLPLIYHVKNSGDLASFSDFGEEICRIKNLDIQLVRKISDKDLKRPAKRPRNSGLECLFSDRLGLQPLRNWKDALASFIAK